MFKERIYKIWKQFTTQRVSVCLFFGLCSKNEYTKSESNSQRLLLITQRLWHCVQRTNIQNLKAIHNWWYAWCIFLPIVFKERIYKIWKQFTTTFISVFFGATLCSKNEYTKSESNSQRQTGVCWFFFNCVQRTNIQNLKAIHNWVYLMRCQVIIVFKERIYKIWKQFTTLFLCKLYLLLLCSKNEYTKSESNSQLSLPETFQWWIVFKERIYKIWKQFTTNQTSKPIFNNCVQRTNIQNLKAIHNSATGSIGNVTLCSKNEYTKSESNSQLDYRCGHNSRNCVQRTNIQNLKAIHNRKGFQTLDIFIVFKERIYKIWKQFTTLILTAFGSTLLCSKNEYTKSESNSQLIRDLKLPNKNCVQRTNIQNLKAIHNYLLNLHGICLLCSKNEYTKSESNSQHPKKFQHSRWNCVQRTNIQNLKAIHNKVTLYIGCIVLCSKNEYTKSESNSQQIRNKFCAN